MNICDMINLILVVNLNMGMLVGFYELVVFMFDEIVIVLGCEGVLLIFDDFFKGMDDFGIKI